MKDYLILADGNSAHTLKWVGELKKYFRIYVVSFSGFSKGLQSILPASRLIGFSAELSVAGGNISVLKHVKKVAAVISKIQPAYLNAHYITSYGTVAYLAKYRSGSSAKLILSAWGSDVLVTPNQNKLYFYLTRFLLGHADFVTSDSVFMSNRILQINSKAEVLTFPFGIESLPAISSTEKNDWCFFSNRALEPNYNIDRVVQLFAYLHSQLPTRHLVVANVGSELSKIKSLVKELGIESHIDFVGFLTEEQQREYYTKCRYYFSLPTSDSTSVSLLEAMAYGCIPIISDIPANREWITPGENGCIGNQQCEQALSGLLNEQVFHINRDIIAQRAIWKNNIQKFIGKICM